ncbi:MAG: prenyltransferase, partial [Microcella sp.]|nr:prenyltransferase [Microcella sp.]
IADREGGLASIATVIGARATVRLAVVAYVLAGLLLLGTEWPGPLAAIAAVPYVVITARFWMITDETAESANRGWKRFLLLNFVAGAIVTMLMIYWSIAR